MASNEFDPFSVMSNRAMKKIIAAVEATPLFHLDDVYIGMLIEQAELSSEMKTSPSICSGVGSIMYGGQRMEDIRTNTCLLAGITVYHKVVSKNMMEELFKRLYNRNWQQNGETKKINLTEKCFNKKVVSQITDRWKGTTRVVAEHWKTLFDNFLDLHN